MKASLILAILALVLAATTVHTNLILSSKGKKHKDLIVLGKKCEPTIIKSSGKKGKYGQTVVMNNDEHDCHESKSKYIPIPMVYQDYYPKHQIVHESHHYFPMEPMYHQPMYFDEKNSLGYGGQGMGGGFAGGNGGIGNAGMMTGHGKFSGFGNLFDGFWA